MVTLYTYISKVAKNADQCRVVNTIAMSYQYVLAVVHSNCFASC